MTCSPVIVNYEDLSCHTCRAEGRVLVFQYVRGSFSSQDENRLNTGVKTIVAENNVCRHSSHI